MKEVVSNIFTWYLSTSLTVHVFVRWIVMTRFMIISIYQYHCKKFRLIINPHQYNILCFEHTKMIQDRRWFHDTNLFIMSFTRQRFLLHSILSDLVGTDKFSNELTSNMIVDNKKIESLIAQTWTNSLSALRKKIYSWLRYDIMIFYSQSRSSYQSRRVNKTYSNITLYDPSRIHYTQSHNFRYLSHQFPKSKCQSRSTSVSRPIHEKNSSSI